MTTETLPDALKAVMLADDQIEKARSSIITLDQKERAQVRDYFQVLERLCAEAQGELE